MEEHLKEITHASFALIELIWSDHEQLEKSIKKLEALSKTLELSNQQFLEKQFHPAANYYHGQMFASHKRLEEPRVITESEIETTLAKIEAKKTSIAALSGAILQIAKQSISRKYGKPENTPAGAKIHGLLVKEIITEGRNQSSHYENPREISEKVVRFFARLDLARSDGETWDARSETNYAFEIVKFLGWRTFSDFEMHIKSFRSKKSI